MFVVNFQTLIDNRRSHYKLENWSLQQSLKILRLKCMY